MLVIALAGCDAAAAKSNEAPKLWHCVFFDLGEIPSSQPIHKQRLLSTCFRSEAECDEAGLDCLLAEKAWCGRDRCAFKKENCDLGNNGPCKHVAP